jgi:hypothetical protein
MGRESLPLANVVAASRVRIARPRRHWTAIMIIAALVLLAGIRFADHRWGWWMFAAGAIVGAWAWFFHRQRVWIVRLHLLLNQRIQILFERVEDADEFLSALSGAKGGALKVARM